MEEQNQTNLPSTLSNKQMIMLAARLKYQAEKEYNQAKVMRAGSIGASVIGLGTLLTSTAIGLDDIKNIPQNAAALGVYGTIGGIGLSGISRRSCDSAYQKEEVANHIISALVNGVDFRQCSNYPQAINLVGQNFLENTASEEDSSVVQRTHEYYYLFGCADRICKNSLNKHFSTKVQEKINYQAELIENYIMQNSCLNMASSPQSTQPNHTTEEVFDIPFSTQIQ